MNKKKTPNKLSFLKKPLTYILAGSFVLLAGVAGILAWVFSGDSEKKNPVVPERTLTIAQQQFLNDFTLPENAVTGTPVSSLDFPENLLDENETIIKIFATSDDYFVVEISKTTSTGFGTQTLKTIEIIKIEDGELTRISGGFTFEQSEGFLTYSVSAISGNFAIVEKTEITGSGEDAVENTTVGLLNLTTKTIEIDFGVYDEIFFENDLLFLIQNSAVEVDSLQTISLIIKDIETNDIIISVSNVLTFDLSGKYFILETIENLNIYEVNDSFELLYSEENGYLENDEGQIVINGLKYNLSKQIKIQYLFGTKFLIQTMTLVDHDLNYSFIIEGEEDTVAYVLNENVVFDIDTGNNSVFGEATKTYSITQLGVDGYFLATSFDLLTSTSSNNLYYNSNFDLVYEIDSGYGTIEYFRDGVYFSVNEYGYSFILNQFGEYVSDCGLSSTSQVSDGMVFANQEGFYFGLKSTQGAWLSNQLYLYLTPFVNGQAVAGKISYVCITSEEEYLETGVNEYEENWSWFVVDENGTETEIENYCEEFNEVLICGAGIYVTKNGDNFILNYLNDSISEEYVGLSFDWSDNNLFVFAQKEDDTSYFFHFPTKLKKSDFDTVFVSDDVISEDTIEENSANVEETNVTLTNNEVVPTWYTAYTTAIYIYLNGSHGDAYYGDTSSSSFTANGRTFSGYAYSYQYNNYTNVGYSFNIRGYTSTQRLLKRHKYNQVVYKDTGWKLLGAAMGSVTFSLEGVDTEHIVTESNSILSGSSEWSVTISGSVVSKNGNTYYYSYYPGDLFNNSWLDLYLTPNTYTVTLNANGGSCSTSSKDVTYYNTYGWHSFPYNDSLNIPVKTMGSRSNLTAVANSIERTGYVFDGWGTSSSGGTKIVNKDGSLVPGVSGYTDSSGRWIKNSNTTLYARWTYVIVYNSNNNSSYYGTATGSTAPVVYYLNLTTNVASNGFSRTGYTFGGWYKETACTNKVTSTSSNWNTNSSTVTLYAKWIPVTYTVTLNNNPSTIAYWSSTGESIEYLSSTAVTNTKSFTFYSTSSIGTPTAAMSFSGYDFQGWYIYGGVQITDASGNLLPSVSGYTDSNKKWIYAGSVTLYARWIKTSKTISFTLPGDASATSYSNVGDFSKSYSFTNRLLSGMSSLSSLLGLLKLNFNSVDLFNIDTDGDGIANKNNGSQTGSSVSWTFVNITSNNGVISKKSNLKCVAVIITIQSVGSDKYNITVDFRGVSGDVSELVLEFNNIYSVVYNSNKPSGSSGIITGSTASSIHVYETDKNLTKNGYVLPGYLFSGWALTSGGDVVYSDENLVKNLTSTNGAIVTLYAKWKANPYTIVYNKNNTSANGTMVNSQHVYDVSKKLSANGYSLLGYSFAGWATSTSGAVVYSDGQSVSNLTSTYNGVVTLYAKWTANQYKIEFDSNGGSNVAAANIVFNTIYNNFNISSIEGYIFDGWFLTETDDNGTGIKIIDNSGNLIANVSGYTDSNKKWIYDDDVTVYAKWIPITYTIKYNANTGAGTMADTTGVNYDSYVTLRTNIFTKTGNSFAGWNTVANGSGVSFGDEEEVLNLVLTNDASITLYAQWNTELYDVAFDSNGGSVVSTIKIGYNSVYSNFPIPTRMGYTFGGWYLSVGGTGTPLTTSSSTNNVIASVSGYTDSSKRWVKAANITVYAKWTASTFKINFDANGGSTVSQANVVFNTAYSTFNISSKTGFTFGGWYLTETNNNGTGTKLIDENGNLIASVSSYTDLNKKWIKAASITVYAKWTANPYDISFDANGGTVTPESKTVTYNSTYGTLPVPNDVTRTGYTFVGWFTASSGGTQIISITTVTTASNHILYAQWTANTYKIVYESDVPDNTDSIVSGMTAYSTHTFDIAQFLTTNGYVLPGYLFSGWALTSGGDVEYADGTEVTNLSSTDGTTVYLYARWTAITYSVIYDGNKPSGASGSVTGSTASSNHTYDVAKVLTANGFALTGYHFVGWNIVSNGTGTAFSNGQSVSNLTTVNNSEITLYAVWVADELIITFDANSGTVTPQTKTVTYDQKYGELPIPTKANYVFDGWYTALSGGTQVTSETTVLITEDQILYARWKFDVTFNNNDGAQSYQIAAGSMSNVTFYYGQTQTLSLNAFSRLFYDFDGWNTLANGSGISFEDAETSVFEPTNGVLNLFAQWTATQYSITYVLDGGTNSNSNPSSYTIEDLAVTLQNPTKTGYAFEGWTVEGESYKTIPAHNTTGNLTITATWSQLFSVQIEYKSVTGSDIIKYWSGTAWVDAEVFVFNSTHPVSISSFNMIGSITGADGLVYRGYTLSSTNYRFIDWTIGSTSFTAETLTFNANENVSIVANYVERVLVTFNANGGTTTLANLEVDYGASFAGEVNRRTGIKVEDVVLPTATKTNLNFNKWVYSLSAEIEGYNIFKTTDEIFEKTTVFAHYQAVVSYAPFDSALTNFVQNNQTVEIGKLVSELDANTTWFTFNVDNTIKTYPLNNKNYRFVGWFASRDENAIEVTEITQNTTLYAKFIERVSIRFDLNNVDTLNIDNYENYLKNYFGLADGVSNEQPYFKFQYYDEIDNIYSFSIDAGATINILPDAPAKKDASKGLFLGWTVDGTDDIVTSATISATTTFVATYEAGFGLTVYFYIDSTYVASTYVFRIEEGQSITINLNEIKNTIPEEWLNSIEQDGNPMVVSGFVNRQTESDVDIRELLTYAPAEAELLTEITVSTDVLQNGHIPLYLVYTYAD